MQASGGGISADPKVQQGRRFAGNYSLLRGAASGQYRFSYSQLVLTFVCVGSFVR